MLHNAHNAPQLIQTISSLLSEASDVHSSFRLWLTSEVTCFDLPTSLLHTSVRIVVDVPKVSFFVFVFSCMFILLSRENGQCAIRARLGVAGHLSTTLSVFPNGTTSTLVGFFSILPFNAERQAGKL